MEVFALTGCFDHMGSVAACMLSLPLPEELKSFAPSESLNSHTHPSALLDKTAAGVCLSSQPCGVTEAELARARARERERERVRAPQLCTAPTQLTLLYLLFFYEPHIAVFRRRVLFKHNLKIMPCGPFAQIQTQNQPIVHIHTTY